MPSEIPEFSLPNPPKMEEIVSCLSNIYIRELGLIYLASIKFSNYLSVIKTVAG